MPTYVFECHEKVKEISCLIKDYKESIPKCERCGEEMNRNYTLENSMIRMDSIPGGEFVIGLPYPKGFKVPDHIKDKKKRAEYAMKHGKYYSRSDMDKACNRHNDNVEYTMWTGPDKTIPVTMGGDSDKLTPVTHGEALDIFNEREKVRERQERLSRADRTRSR